MRPWHGAVSLERRDGASSKDNRTDTTHIHKYDLRWAFSLLSWQAFLFLLCFQRHFLWLLFILSQFSRNVQNMVGAEMVTETFIDSNHSLTTSLFDFSFLLTFSSGKIVSSVYFLCNIPWPECSVGSLMETVCYTEQELSSNQRKTEQTGLAWELKAQWKQSNEYV